jgi:hypothetical protein
VLAAYLGFNAWQKEPALPALKYAFSLRILLTGVSDFRTLHVPLHERTIHSEPGAMPLNLVIVALLSLLLTSLLGERADRGVP